MSFINRLAQHACRFYSFVIALKWKSITLLPMRGNE